MSLNRFWLAVLLFAPAALAQQWEAGGLGGFGITRDTTITNATGSASAGFKNGPLFGAFAGSNDYRYLGGEVSYLYRQSDAKLSSAAREVPFGGHTQFLDFRFLVHLQAEKRVCVRFWRSGAGLLSIRGQARRTQRSRSTTLGP